MTRDITKFVKDCEVCQKCKFFKKIKEPVQITPTPIRPFDTVIIDTVGPLYKSVHGFTYFLRLICDLTKYLITIPLKTKSANEVAKA